MRNRIIILVCFIMCLIQSYAFCAYDDTSVEVFVTVTDISDSENPLNVIFERQPLTVSNSDISKYGEGFCDIPLLDSGVTYLHAILKLHEDLYGTENVEKNFYMDSSYITHIFMGRPVTSIMYKNGKDIFAHPQYIRLKNGDEINICLYNEGHSQLIASFDEAYVYAAPGDEILLNIYEHNSFPQITNPIYDAHITDENGVYITDSDDNIISSDINGNFSVSFESRGEHKITIMPQLNYYLSEEGGITKVWYEEELVKIPDEYFGDKSVFVFDWNGTGVSDVEDYKDNLYHEQTVRKEEFIPGVGELMCQYTVPWVIVNVTDEVFFVDVTEVSNMVKFRVKNSQNHSGDIYCAGYKYDNGIERMVCLKSEELSEYHIFSFNNKLDVDYFKIFAWDEDMIPLCEAYIKNDKAEQEWNKTMPAPENVILSGKN